MLILDPVMSPRVSACFVQNMLGNKSYPELVSTRMRRWQWERKVEGEETGRHAVKEWGVYVYVSDFLLCSRGGRGIPQAA